MFVDPPRKKGKDRRKEKGKDRRKEKGKDRRKEKGKDRRKEKGNFQFTGNYLRQMTNNSGYLLHCACR